MIKRILKPALKIAIVFALFHAIENFCHKQTDGFAFTKLVPSSMDPIHFVQQETNGLHDICNQRFFYLSKGAQCYVFCSEDNQYVIKFFRNRIVYPFHLIDCIPHPKLVGEFWKKKQEKRKKMRQKDFESYQIAWNTLRAETGLVHLHLHKGTAFPMKTIRIVDKLGIEHSVDIKNWAFVIQKKASLIPDTFAQWIEQNEDFDQAKKAMSALFQLLKTRIDKGIADSDPNFKKNFGFIDHQPIQIDIGRFYENGDPYLGLKRTLEDFQHYLDQHYPELLPHFHNEIKQTLGKNILS